MGYHYNDNQSAGDMMFRQQLAQNGCNYVEVPLNAMTAPTVTAIKQPRFTTIVDPGGNVYQTPNWSFSTMNVSSSSYQPQVVANTTNQPQTMQGVTRTYPPRRISDMLPDGWTIGCGDVKQPLLGPIIECRLPRADPGVREGLRIVPACQVVRLDMPISPDKELADAYFNDALFVSLQADILPKGANPLDDYLHKYEDSRMRIYLNAVIGNQGCHCQHSDLDRLLDKEKSVFSAIALRATLSDQCRLRLQEPSDVKPLVDHVRVMRGIVEGWDRYHGELLSKMKPPPKGPWDAPDEDSDMQVS